MSMPTPDDSVITTSDLHEFDEAIRLNPNDAEAYCNRGRANVQLGRYEEAISDCDEAISLNPTYAEAYGRRGFANGELGRHEEAIADCDQAIRLNPNDADVYYNRGLANWKLGRPEDAIADCDQAIRLDPTYALAYLIRGLANGELGRYEEAMSDCNEAIRLNPNDANAYGLRGGVKAELGRPEDVIADCNEAIRLDPTYSVAYALRGWANVELGRHIGAIADCDKALSLDSNLNSMAYFVRGNAKLSLRRYEESISDYDEYFNLNPENDDPVTKSAAYNNRGNAKEKLNRFEEARQDWRLAATLESSSSQTSVSSSVVQRPNQETLVRALNIYRDAMRPFILTNLTQEHGASGLKDAIIEALGDEQGSNFERDLDRNGGNIEATLDVNHFLPIAQHHWDSVFFAKFGYDQSMLGTLRWINRARNDVAHPGTTDISEDDTQQHFSNILKTLDRINASFEQRNAVQSLKDTLGSGLPDALPTTDDLEFISSISVCTKFECAEPNEGRINELGRASITCKKCSTNYNIETSKALSVRRQTRPEQRRGGTVNVPYYTMRTEAPNGTQNTLTIVHENLVVDRGDVIVTSWEPNQQPLDSSPNGQLKIFYNVKLDTWWRTEDDPLYVSSICANTSCEQESESSRITIANASVVCKACSTRYIRRVAKVLAVQAKPVTLGDRDTRCYVIRTEDPNGKEQDVITIYHDHLIVERGDVIVTSWVTETGFVTGTSPNGQLMQFGNVTLGRWWRTGPVGGAGKVIARGVGSWYVKEVKKNVRGSGCAIAVLAMTTPVIVGAGAFLFWALS